MPKFSGFIKLPAISLLCLQVSDLYAVPTRFYESLNEQNQMCELCMFSQIQSQITIATMYIYSVPNILPTLIQKCQTIHNDIKHVDFVRFICIVVCNNFLLYVHVQFIIDINLDPVTAKEALLWKPNQLSDERSRICILFQYL